MIWQLTLNEPWFEYVRSGKKRFEGRRWNHQVCKFQVGDTIIFRKHQDTDSFRKEIQHIHHFITFETGLEYFQQLGLLPQVLPNVETVEAGTKIYYQFVSLETQLQDTVCFIELN